MALTKDQEQMLFRAVIAAEEIAKTARVFRLAHLYHQIDAAEDKRAIANSIYETAREDKKKITKKI